MSSAVQASNPLLVAATAKFIRWKPTQLMIRVWFKSPTPVKKYWTSVYNRCASLIYTPWFNLRQDSFRSDKIFRDLTSSTDLTWPNLTLTFNILHSCLIFYILLLKFYIYILHWYPTLLLLFKFYILHWHFTFYNFTFYHFTSWTNLLHFTLTFYTCYFIQIFYVLHFPQLMYHIL